MMHKDISVFTFAPLPHPDVKCRIPCHTCYYWPIAIGAQYSKHASEPFIDDDGKPSYHLNFMENET